MPSSRARATFVVLVFFIRSRTALIFFRPLLVESEHADDFLELLIFPAELGDLQGAGSGIVGLDLEPCVQRIVAHVIFCCRLRYLQAVFDRLKTSAFKVESMCFAICVDHVSSLGDMSSVWGTGQHASCP